jgi:DNA primase
MRIPRGFSDELRNQADILRVIGDYVSLKKKGGSYWACCPFHHEKTPSFSVYPAKQFYKCFGCHKGGDVFNFVMEIEGCSFPEAVKTIAEKCGIAVPVEENARDYQERDRLRADLLQINQLATEFFEQNLTETAEGKRALAYLSKRKVSEQSRVTFRLGYAPDKWDAMGSYLRSRGLSRTQIEQSGLVSLKENGSGYYDRFRNRLIFPISDTQGRVIAFGGRILGDGEPKYLNSPETAVYTKGQNLYGLNQAREAIRKRGYTILVEGYLDFLIPFQAGVRNIVAGLGTALTEQQVRLLGRYARRIVVNFDPDSAGISATKRSLELLLGDGFKVNVLSLPDNLDPDEYIRTQGVEGYQKLLKGSQPYLDYIVDQAISANDQTKPGGKVETINAILPYLKLVNDRIERAEHFERIADRLKLESKLIRQEFKKAVEIRSEHVSESAVTAAIAVKPAERKLLEILLNFAELRREMIFQLTEDDIKGLRTAQLFRLLLDFERVGQEASYLNLSRALEDEDLARDLLPQLLSVGLTDDSTDQNILKRAWREASESLFSLRCNRLAEKQAELQIEIIQAQRTKDLERINQLSMLKLELAKRERELVQMNGK